MKLSRPYSFQGNRLHVDNFYSSPRLSEDWLGWGITATGTLRTNTTGVPDKVKQLKSVPEKRSVHRGLGYYIQESGSEVVYVCWCDKCTAAAISPAFPDHSDSTVVQKTEEKGGSLKILKVIITTIWGVDKSDQLLSYHYVFRKTV